MNKLEQLQADFNKARDGLKYHLRQSELFMEDLRRLEPLLKTQEELQKKNCWMCGADVQRMCWCHMEADVVPDVPCTCAFTFTHQLEYEGTEKVEGQRQEAAVFSIRPMTKEELDGRATHINRATN